MAIAAIGPWIQLSQRRQIVLSTEENSRFVTDFDIFSKNFLPCGQSLCYNRAISSLSNCARRMPCLFSNRLFHAVVSPAFCSSCLSFCSLVRKPFWLQSTGPAILPITLAIA